MTISYTLVPNPLWYFTDLTGKPLGGGWMRTSRFQNPTQAKPVFQDSGGNNAWPTQPIGPPNHPVGGNGGIAFDMDGEQGPFFWEFDTNNPSDAYFIEVFDSNGNLVFNTGAQPFGPGVAGGGGGGSITTGINLENFIINGEFWEHNGVDGVSFIPGIQTTIAPGAHTGLVSNGLGSSLTIVNAAPDICFVKTNLTATDTLTFNTFGPGDTTFLPDVTPRYFLNYTCSVLGTDTVKAVQIPITSKVQNLVNQNVSIKFWARTSSPGVTLNLQWVQFFGDGAGATNPLMTPIGPFLPSATWGAFTIITSIPNVAGATLGACNNDGLFLQIQYPTNVTGSIDIAKPAVYLGITIPIQDFQTNDQIEAIFNTPRTGDIRMSLNSFAPFGWLAMNDQTIGSPTSGSGRANIDTFPLFSLIWNLFVAHQPLAPMFDSSNNPINYGASAISDFSANNRLSLTKAAGRLFANIGTPSTNSVTVVGGSNTGTNWAIGQTTGYELHTQQGGEVGLHTHGHTITGGFTSFVGEKAGAGQGLQASGNETFGADFIILNNAVPTAMNIQNAVSYVNVFIKL